MKCRGLRVANNELSLELDNKKSRIESLHDMIEMLQERLYYQELYIIAIDEEIDNSFNHVLKRRINKDDL